MNIKSIRKLSGFTQEEFALHYQIPVQTLKQWEANPKSRSHRECPIYLVRLLEQDVLRNNELNLKDYFYHTQGSSHISTDADVQGRTEPDKALLKIAERLF